MSKLSPHVPEPTPVEPSPTVPAPEGTRDAVRPGPAKPCRERRAEYRNAGRSTRGRRPNGGVPAETYSREYFLTECQGYQDFLSGHISARLQTALQLAGDLSGKRVLDVGSGRGEVVVRCAREGADAYGVDYAPEALALAGAAVSAQAEPFEERVHFQRGDGQHLPFRDAAFDCAFMLDIVEHLYPEQLQRAFSEVGRILGEDGVLIIHTMPNLWYYRLGYPLYRLVQRVRGQKLPRDPRQRWQFVPTVHVNEQDIWRLGRALREAGFQARVWLQPTQSYGEERNPLARLCMRILVNWYPFRWVFCDEIFALARKRR
jgi:SAM-dependent methyltransferase